MTQSEFRSDILHIQHAQVGLSVTSEVLIISIQVELYDDVLNDLQQRSLSMLQEHGLKSLILDLSHVQLLDQEMAKRLENILVMAKLLGAHSVVVGIQPNIAACMSHWGHTWKGIQTARNIDDGLCLLANA